MSLLDKLIKFLKKIRDLFSSKKTENKSSKPIQPTTPSQSKAPAPSVPVESNPPAPGQEEVEHDRREPAWTNMEKADITSFLWKPSQDHKKGYPVVLVSADHVRSEDISVEIIGKGGKPLKVDVDNTGRANLLGGDKYGRIHFRINRTSRAFKRSAPLKLRFTVKGKPVKVMGRDTINVPNPVKRKQTF